MPRDHHFQTLVEHFVLLGTCNSVRNILPPLSPLLKPAVFWPPVSQGLRDLGSLVTWSVLLSIFPIRVLPAIPAVSVGTEAPTAPSNV